MNASRTKSGFTLIEMIIVVVVIAILVSIVMMTATRIQNKAKEQLTKNTLGILNAALGEFADYGYRYKGEDNTALSGGDIQRRFYSELKFPLDCDELSNSDDIRTELADAMWVNVGDIDLQAVDKNAFGCEVMYFLLSRLPQCQKVLEGIDGSLVKTNGTIEVNTIKYPWLRVVDAWGKALRYDLYNEAGDYGNRIDTRRSFPLIISAGADGLFDTAADNITNE